MPARTPEQIIGEQAVRALMAAGYKIVEITKPAMDGFEQWWKLYPCKVGKGAAEQAWKKAVSLAPLEVLLDGVQRYAAKQDDRPWCNPSTWLNQKRWLDEEPVPVVQLQPQRGIAGVRQRLEREITNGSPAHLGHQGPDRRFPERLSLFDERG